LRKRAGCKPPPRQTAEQPPPLKKAKIAPRVVDAPVTLNSPISMAASSACLWRCTPEASSFCWIVVTGSMNMATTRLVLPAKIFWTSRRSVSENGADSNRVKSVSKVIEQFGDHVPQWH
jgi:hypothetical protein